MNHPSDPKVPVVVVTGPVGVGKTTVLREADSLLVAAGVTHATVELEDVARFWSESAAKRGRADIAYRNLASVWANYSSTGADRLLLGLLVEKRADLLPVYESVPGAEITVVRLYAPITVIAARLRVREKTISGAEVSAAQWWTSRLEGSTMADFVVDNSERPPHEVARELLQAIGWLAS